MKNRSVQRLVVAALFTALTCIATLAIRIPALSTGGYINLGDSIVLAAAWILSPAYGVLSAALGSMLADLIAGYAMFAPATFVIKGCMALVGGLVFRALLHIMPRKIFVRCLVSAVIAEAIMVFGYCGFEWVVLGLGPAAIAGMPGNLIQALGGGSAAIAVYLLMQRNTTIHAYLEQLR